MIIVDNVDVSLTIQFIKDEGNISKLSILVDLGRWNIALIAFITTTSGLFHHGSMHAPSMELQTACTKSDFLSLP